jgi:hypothetical protein
MHYSRLVAPVLGLVVAGAAAAQVPYPQNPQPARPAPSQPATPRTDPTPSQPATPQTVPQPSQPASAPSGTVTQVPVAPAVGPQTWLKARLDTLLYGITLSAAVKTQVDSIVNAQALLVSANANDSLMDAATRQRMLGMLDQIDSAVRGLLTVGQAATFDSNLDAWRRRQRSPVASN